MAVTSEDLKEYLRLPHNNITVVGEATVDNYLAAAKSKAKAAGIPVFENNAQYDLFILALAAMYYDNRGMAFDGQDKGEQAARNIINSFVNELRYAEEDES